MIFLAVRLAILPQFDAPGVIFGFFGREEYTRPLGSFQVRLSSPKPEWGMA